MLTPLRPAYPSEEAIRYAWWLKQFATQLPAYAERYDLSMLQLLEVQSSVGEYLDLLIWRAHYTTASIVRQPPARALVAAQVWAREAASYAESTQAIQGLVSKVVAHIRRHPAYTDPDGQALHLEALLRPAF